MPRDIDATFKQEKAKQENRPLFLYIIEDYDGSNDLYLAGYDEDVIYNGVTYTRFPITHEFVGENNQGQIDQVKVRLANVSRLIQLYLEQYDFRGRKVIIRTVWADQLADPDAYIDDIFYVDNYTADQNNVEFTLTSKFDVLGMDLPARRYARNYCSWKFKSAECGYMGVELTCDKTKQRCKQLNNYQRYGAFPSVPTRRIYIM
jgi:lambda family phage minor tail protein L